MLTTNQTCIMAGNSRLWKHHVWLNMRLSCMCANDMSLRNSEASARCAKNLAHSVYTTAAAATAAAATAAAAAVAGHAQNFVIELPQQHKPT